jgi:hypothetical protein
MKPVLFVLMAMATGMLSLPLSGCTRENAMDRFEQTLQIAASGKRVLVTLTFSNHGDRPVFVRDMAAVHTELTAPLFDVSTDTGAPIPYIGKMVKRGPITADDYHAVAPRSSLSNTIDITRSYGFLPGTHRYRLSYQVTYLTDLTQPDTPEKGPVLETEFTYMK